MPSLEELLLSQGKDLYSRFVKKYEEPKSTDYLFALAYESFNALHQSIQSGGNVKDQLYLKEFQGITGNFSFDQNGDVIGTNHVIKKIADGKVVTLE